VNRLTRSRLSSKKHSSFVSQKHDDLWILRFCLSQKKTKNIVKAAEHALEFHQEHKLDETDLRFSGTMKGSPDLPDPFCRWVEHCTDDAIQYTIPNPKRGVICFPNFAGVDAHALMANLYGWKGLAPQFHVFE